MEAIAATEEGVVVIAKSGCKYCTMANGMLGDLGVAYTYKNLQEGKPDDEFRRDVDQLEKITGSRTFPQIFSRGKYLGGFSDVENMYMFNYEKLAEELGINPDSPPPSPGTP